MHAFATDPARGVFILAFLVVVIGGSLALFAWRAPRVGLGGSFEPVSRESLLLANNVLLLVAAAAVLLGTLYPLVLDALGLGKISVGPPYFDTVFVPLMAPALFLMGIGPIARWSQASLPDLADAPALGRRRQRGQRAVLAFFALGKLDADDRPGAGAGGLDRQHRGDCALLERACRRTSRAQLAARASRPSRAASTACCWRMSASRCSSSASPWSAASRARATCAWSRATPPPVAGYQVRLDKIEDVQGPELPGRARHAQRHAATAALVATVTPEKRVYNVSRMPMTEVAIDRGLLRDLYVALGEPVGATAWSVRLYHKPFVNWIWGGCVLMALGGLLAVIDRRYRGARAADGATGWRLAARRAAAGRCVPQPRRDAAR